MSAEDRSRLALGARERCVASLARALQIGPLYPPGHARLEALVDELRAALRAVSEGAERVVFELGEERLHVAGEPVPLEQGPAQRMHEHLRCLGLARVELERDLTPDDLHRTASLLASASRQRAGSAVLPELDLSGLPERVALVRRVFGRRAPTRSPEGGESDGPPPSDAGAPQGSSEPQPDELGPGDGGDGGDGAEHGTSGGSPPLEDVLDAGTHTLRLALQNCFGEELAPEQLAGLMKIAERALGGSESAPPAQPPAQPPIRLTMRPAIQPPGIDLSQGEDSSPSAAVLAFGARSDEPPVPGTLDEKELLAQLAAHRVGAAPLANLADPDRAETLSILLRLLADEPDCGARPGFAGAVKRCLEGELSPRAARVLSLGFAELCSRPAETVDRAFPPLARLLRASIPDRFHLALGEVLRVAARDELEALWPHAANEVLLGAVRANMELERAMLARVESLGSARIRAGMKRLVRLGALADDGLRHRLAVELVPGTGVLLAELAASPSGRSHTEMLTELARAHSQRWPGALALEALNARSTAGRAFLVQELRELGLGAPSPKRREAAGQVLLERLRSLPAARHDESWVAPALTALGDLRYSPALEFLRTVARERRALLLAAWSPECRRAARRSIGRLNG